MKSYGTWIPMSDLFHSTQYTLDPSMLLQMARFHSFLWLSQTPLNACTMFLKNSLFLFSYSCPHCSLIPLPCPAQPPFPHSVFPSPLSLSMGPLYMFLDLTLPLLSLVTPSPPLWSLLVCSLFPCLWFYFASCLFCWLGSTYRWDHMVFVFHRLAYFT